jgi:hypothetical protein
MRAPSSIPLDEPPLLDVTLTRDGQKRRWTITPWTMGWTCQYSTVGEVTSIGCATLELVATKVREWEAKIETARADGWS